MALTRLAIARPENKVGMQDEIDAIRFAAEQGDAKAQSHLGLMYDEGLGVSQDYAEAARWFRLAAEQGDAGAQCQLRAMYAIGRGVSRDQVKAYMWLSLAAVATQPSEHRDFAVRFRDKVAAGLSVEDLALSQELASNWSPSNIDAIQLGVIRTAAEQGHPGMQCFLGSRYAAGRDVPRDYAEAAKWFRLAAEQGDVEAQSVLGLMYQEGKGVPQDHAEAVRWLRLAAEQGHAKAQAFLGSMYAFGKGVPEDYREAPSGTAVPPSKTTPTLSTTSGPCTRPAKDSLRTTQKPLGGIASPPNRATPTLSVASCTLRAAKTSPKATQKPRCPGRQPSLNQASASGWESESASRSALRSSWPQSRSFEDHLTTRTSAAALKHTDFSIHL